MTDIPATAVTSPALRTKSEIRSVSRPSRPQVQDILDDHADDHDHAHHDEHLEPISFTAKLVTLLAMLIPFAGLIVAVVGLWGWGFNWVYAGLLAAMYLITAVGVTVGYHRLFTHRSFKTGPVVRAALAMMGSMAVEGPVLKWAAMHRCHHQHSDDDHDPHSPHGHGGGTVGVLKGMWHAHMGWMLRGDPKNLVRYVPDLRADKVIRTMNKLWVVWVILGLLIPAALGGLLTMSWTGALLGFLWGGLVRIFLVHHVTWSINSVCHLWGTRPFRSHDESRNNFIFGILGLGEGWHNNHHAFPTSARHGLRWWEIDLSYEIIRLMALVGLAWDVKVPDRARLTAKQATSTPTPTPTP